MTDESNLAGLVEKVNEIADASPEAWDAARALVARHAPDCADVIFGLNALRDHDQTIRLQRGLGRTA